jgi:hypothetical protein
MSIGQISLPDGQLVMLNVVEGRASMLGQFHGQILVPSSDGIVPEVFLNLYGDGGSTLRMTVQLVGMGGGNDGPTQIRGRYEITGGAGSLQDASGAGTILAIPDPDSNGFTVAMQGQIAV